MAVDGSMKRGEKREAIQKAQSDLEQFLRIKKISCADSRQLFLEKADLMLDQSKCPVICISCIIKEWSDIALIEDELSAEKYFIEVTRKIYHAIGEIDHGIFIRSALNELSLFFSCIEFSQQYYEDLPKNLIEYSSFSYKFKEIDLPSRLSIGISRSNLDMHAHNMNSLLLLNQARAVADNNKGSHHESTAKFFAVNKDQSKNIKDKKKIEKLIKSKIARRDFVPFLQPVCNSKTSQIQGFECLARMIIDEEIIKPEVFLPVIKRNGLSAELDLIMLEKAIATAGLIHTKYPHLNFSFNVNVSGSLMETKSQRETFLKIIDLANLHPSKKIQVEVIEDSFNVDSGELNDFFKNLSSKGVKIYIDDFGLGFSSLERVFSLPIAGVKLDSFFMSAVRSNNHRRRLFFGKIIQTIRDVGFDIVAEGIESQSELRWINELGVPKYQGYFFGKPQNINQTLELIQQQNIHPSAIKPRKKIKPFSRKSHIRIASAIQNILRKLFAQERRGR